ncbi:MAG: fcl, partial [Bacteriovoracaceae bacterium]|nr:fcl [Bacteriovoracaceae bacterium]
GGIGANSTYPVEFLLENLRIQNNVISAAAEFAAKKLVFLGSSCIYPKNARYPLTEDQFLTGPFEPTNEAYAIAKAVGVKLCEAYYKQYGKNFVSVMPTNLYGPNDYYHLENSHVIPAMMLKILKAKKDGRESVTLWGTGKPLREFLHSDDLAEAIYLCLEKHNAIELMNIGSGEEISTFDLAKLISKVCGYKGEIKWDTTKPDGIARKIMDSKKMTALGWKAKISLEEGLRSIITEAEGKLS